MATLNFDPDIVVDQVQQLLTGEQAIDPIVASGAVKFMPGEIGTGKLGNTIVIPQLSFPGRFVFSTSPSGSTTFNAIGTTDATATVNHASYGSSIDDWNLKAMKANGDPNVALARVITSKFYDSLLSTLTSSSGEIYDNATAYDYSATGAMSVAAIRGGLNNFGDERETGEKILLCHSQQYADLLGQETTTGADRLAFDGQGKPIVPQITKIFPYDRMQTDSGPTRYYAFLLKAGACIVYYDPSTFELREWEDITVQPTTMKWKFEGYFAAKLLNPMGGGSKKGAIRIKTQ